MEMTQEENTALRHECERLRERVKDVSLVVLFMLLWSYDGDVAMNLL